jgi:hypothetical protein
MLNIFFDNLQILTEPIDPEVDNNRDKSLLKIYFFINFIFKQNLIKEIIFLNTLF